MESSSTPPRHICRKCGIKIKSTRNYCETCEDEPECPLCNRLTHQIGSICDDCLDYDISIDTPPTTPPPLPPKKRYRSSFKGNTNNDKYIIKYPKNNNNNQSDEDDKNSENDSDTNKEKIEINIRNKRNDKNKKSKITKKSIIYNTDSNKDKFLDEDEITIRNSINNRVDTLDKLLGINTNDINDDDIDDDDNNK